AHVGGRRLLGDGVGLAGGAARLHRQVDLDLLVGEHLHAGAIDLDVAEIEMDGVDAGNQARDGVLAIFVGELRLLALRALRDDGHAGNRLTRRRIGDAADERAAVGALRVGGGHKREDRDNDQTRSTKHEFLPMKANLVHRGRGRLSNLVIRLRKNDHTHCRVWREKRTGPGHGDLEATWGKRSWWWM